MGEETPSDREGPDIAAERERRINIYYRLLESDDVPFTAEDFFLLKGGFDHLTDEEMKALGEASMRIEREGREGLDFAEVTDHERDFARILKKGIERNKASGEVTGEDFPDDFIWDA